jgi:hypothetical protein
MNHPIQMPGKTDAGCAYKRQMQNGTSVILKKNGISAPIVNKPITILLTYEE